MMHTCPQRNGFLTAVICIIGLGLGGVGLAVRPAVAAPFAYVANFSSVSVLDTATNTVVATIPMAEGSNNPPVITPDDAFVYVKNGDVISVIATATNSVVAAFPMAGRKGKAITPDGAFLYVVEDGRPNSTVYVLDTATNILVTTIPVGEIAYGVAITPDGVFAYVTNNSSNSVSVIATATNTVVATIPVGNGPTGVAITPDGAFAYVANVSTPNTTVIATATNTVVATIPMPGGTTGVAITPDGAFVYVTNCNVNIGGDGAVAVVATATNTVVATVPVGSCPNSVSGVAITPDGAFAYVVSTYTNTVWVIDTTTHVVVAVIPVVDHPAGIAIQKKFSSWRLSTDHSGNTGSVTLSIFGPGIPTGSTAALLCSGQPTLVGTNTTVTPYGRSFRNTVLTATFDLTGAASGQCTVVITTPDGSAITVPKPFTIEQGGAPNVWVDIVGPSNIRVSRPSTFYIVYGNRGNVDAAVVPLWIGGIPKGATWKLGFGITLPPPRQEGDEPIDWSQIPIDIEDGERIDIPLFINQIPPGATQVLPITLTIPSSQTFELQTWVYPPFFQAPLSEDAKACLSAIASILLPKAWELIPGGPCAKALTENFTAEAFAITELLRSARDRPISSILQFMVSIHVKIFKLSASECVGMINPALGAIVDAAEFLLSVPEAVVECRNAFITAKLERVSLKRLSIRTIGSQDPNDKFGTQGAGELHYHSGELPLNYVVSFENVPTATAAAQEVIITDQLDLSQFDVNTFSLGPLSFGDQQIVPPLGLSQYTTDVDLRPANNLIVRINASLDMATGLATWRFISLDPVTKLPTEDALAGFLPPNQAPSQGQGSVLFTVKPKQGLPTGTEIRNQATIVFDVNPSMSTQTWLNTLDNDAPTTHVLPLPAVANAASFTVQWAGTDVGSGIQDYTIFVSENGGAFTPFLSNTTATSATFTGQVGKSYAFYSIARDQVGNQENPKTAPEAATQVATDTISPTTTATLSPLPNTDGWNNTNVIVTVTAVDNSGGSGVKELSVKLSGASTSENVVAGSSAAVAITSEGSTTLTYFARDNAGNQEAPKTLTIQIDTTLPTVACSLSPLPNSYGWNNTDVTVTFTASDSLSGVAAEPSSITVITEGTQQPITGTATDKAGNSASATCQVSLDKTLPTLTTSQSPPPNSSGWNNTNVTVSFTASDSLSGVATVSGPATVHTEGAGQVVAGTATDKAGNTASTSLALNIDKTPPTIAGMPAPGCTLWPPNHALVQVATETASDALSNVASFDVQGTSSEPPDTDGPDIIITGSGLQPRGVQLRAERAGNGPGRVYTLTATASDRAGNLAQTTATCTVPHDQRK